MNFSDGVVLHFGLLAAQTVTEGRNRGGHVRGHQKETTGDKQQTLHIVDHKNKRRTDSKVQNVQITRREDDPAAQKLRRKKTKTKKASTSDIFKFKLESLQTST